MSNARQRFEAGWVAKHHADDPDRDEYRLSVHPSRNEAERAAIVGSKLGGVEWIMVSEQQYRRTQWVSIRRWAGDWDGLHEETYSEDQV